MQLTREIMSQAKEVRMLYQSVANAVISDTYYIKTDCEWEEALPYLSSLKYIIGKVQRRTSRVGGGPSEAKV